MHRMDAVARAAVLPHHTFWRRYCWCGLWAWKLSWVGQTSSHPLATAHVSVGKAMLVYIGRLLCAPVSLQHCSSSWCLLYDLAA